MTTRSSGRGLEMRRSMATKKALSEADRQKVIFMLVLGSIMQALAHWSIGPMLFAPVLLAFGWGLVSIAFPERKPELRAFLLAFSACILVGGLAQSYSQIFFNKLQSTLDARHFIRDISRQISWDEMIAQNVNDAPLAVQIWKYFYMMLEVVGFSPGSYIGVIVNALIIGVVGSLSVQAARAVFGDDDWRLRRVGTLVAFYGLFLLFGGVLIRDSFTTFVNVLLFLGILRWLARPTIRRLLTAAVFTGICVWSTIYLRPEAVFIPAVYWALALFVCFFVGTTRSRLNAVFAFALVMLVGGASFASYFQIVAEVSVEETTAYTEMSTDRAATDSLGVRFVVGQPLPIRMLFCSFLQMVYPLPLWDYFRFDRFDYHWIKGYNGIYQMFVLPLVFVGVHQVYRLFSKSQAKGKTLLLIFVFMYVILNLLGVSATSMEQRHFAQFFPAVAILAAIPNTRRLATRQEVQQMSAKWWMLVIGIHLVWIILKIAI